MAHGMAYSPTPYPLPLQNQSCTSPGAVLVSAIWLWTMNANEIRRLAHAINEHRPDWPVSSLTTFITRELSKRTYRDAAVALTWVAVDQKPDGSPASDTPKRVIEGGPWWRAACIEGEQTLTPPKRDEQCRVCGRRLSSCTCGQRATRPTPAANPQAVEQAVAAARAALKEASKS